MAFKSPSINLIRSHKSFFDRFIDWALTFGRIVVIVTEAIALSAFLYRFTLDRQIIDLHGQIKQKQQIISYQKTQEEKFRSLQNRLALAVKLNSQIPISVRAFSDISSLIPSGITVSNFSITNESVAIDASSQSITALSNFIRSLRAYDKIQSVSLDRIENRTSTSTIVFGISMQLKKTL